MNEMASQVIGGAVSQPQVLEIYSFLRGYYAYMENWTAVVGEILVVKIEPTNRHYIDAVAIYKMLKLSPCSLQSSSKNVSIFYERDNKVFAEITELKSTGELDLEVPCVNRIYGPNVYNEGVG